MLIQRWKKIALEKCSKLCHYGRMKPETFGLQATVTGGGLPEEWQTLLASQASTLAALLSRMQTAVGTMRQQQAPVARWQALAAEAERVLTAQAQERRGLGDQHPSRDQAAQQAGHTPRSSKGLGTPWPPCCTTWV